MSVSVTPDPGRDLLTGERAACESNDHADPPGEKKSQDDSAAEHEQEQRGGGEDGLLPVVVERTG
jgi:hypothetical protein